jgi:lysophospholipase L1-like esterase
VVLAGCGSDDDAPAEGPASGSGGGGTVIAALGDSITAGSPGYDPDPAAQAGYGFGDNERSTYTYWAERADPGLEIRNCGVFGERTDQIAARLEACAEGAAGVIVQGGINDIAQGYGSDQPSENLRALVREAKEMGLPVAITDVLPWNNGYPRADPGIAELNTFIAEIAAAEQIPLLPFHDTLEDPSAPGRMKPEWTVDGDHPSVAGYRRLGEIAFKPPS